MALTLLAFGAPFAACGHTDSRTLLGEPAAPAEGGAMGLGSSGGSGRAGRPGGHGGKPANGTGGDDTARAGDGGAAPSPGECGNGTHEAGEECDDGNTTSGDGCSAGCAIERPSATCGDGRVDTNEQCDDGNLESGDGCDDRCRSEQCGNGRVDSGEDCDPPEAGFCTDNCVNFRPHCGDGKVQKDEGEQCDDANQKAGDGCTDCRKDCGDGRIDRSNGEECEPTFSPDRCSSACRWLPFCNDGKLQPEAGEECDPSNGSTCVDCKRATPPPPPCGSEGEGGCGGAPGECVPQQAANLVQNGTFDHDAAAWAPHSSLVTLGVVDDGAPDPKALEVKFASGPVRAVSGAYQCIPVEPGQKYTVNARYRIPSDAPDGVAASVTALVYAGSSCQGTFVSPPRSGPQGSVRNSWTPYELDLDTSGLPTGTTEARVLLRLDVVRPANTDGSRVLWDTVSFAAGGGHCGDCQLDRGEACDDGNQVAGDGCSATCQLEQCGDGVRSPAEQCDDGNTTFGSGDACTPACRTANACDTCAARACSAQLAGCFGLTGVASAGPKGGTARSTLCDSLLTCVRNTGCDLVERTSAGIKGAFMENCYCGTSGDACFEVPGRANGSCRAQVEAALETTKPQLMVDRFDQNAEYPVFAAVRSLLECEDRASGSCFAPCGSGRSPACGNGRVEDRNLDFTFVIDGKDTPCADQYTATGHGCSVEECDDGNTNPGDGCDDHCFLEVCGNNVVQAGEECDDGNTEPNDGCDEHCQLEYVCNNGTVEAPFEECDPPDDPPGSGHVCSKAEYGSDAEKCGCDSACQRIVCGNGRVQRPAEECDPPDGLTCGDDCKRVGLNPCEACITGDAELGYVNDTYCNTQELCVDVKSCIEEHPDCFYPNAGSCYCGDVDFDTCSNPSYKPTGPCRDEIRAGLGGGALTNQQVLDLFFDFSLPTGVATQILLAAAGQPAGTGSCASQCYPDAFPP